MKIALVVPGGVDRGGEARVIPAFLALVARLARRHDVHVYALRQEAAPGEWTLAGARIHNIGDGATRLRAIRAIRAEHRRARFDAVHAIFSGDCSLVAVAAARSLRVPGLVHIAGGELVALPDIDYGGRRRWTSRLREAVVLRAADAVTAASEPILASLRALGIDARRVPLGVDLDAWPPAPPRPRADGPARLLHVASLNRVKDQPTLLRALAILARRGEAFTADFVGVDTLGGGIQALAAQLGLERHVRFRGFMTQRALRPLFADADLLVMASRHEAGPLVALEAAVAGVPTVGTAVGHLAEWAPGAAAVAPVGDAEALAAAIARVLGDEPLRLAMAAAAQRVALVEDADRTAQAFEALYRELA
ncbi:MAG: glycosyltransferase family 4 protein [Luteimonas sp.]